MNVNGRKKNTRGFGEQATSLKVTCPRCGGSGKVAPKAESIGDRFKTCRTKLSKTQAEVAPMLQISRAQLSNLESDRSRPGLEMLVLAADAFGVSIDYLLGRH